MDNGRNKPGKGAIGKNNTGAGKRWSRVRLTDGLRIGVWSQFGTNASAGRLPISTRFLVLASSTQSNIIPLEMYSRGGRSPSFVEAVVVLAVILAGKSLVGGSPVISRPIRFVLPVIEVVILEL